MDRVWIELNREALKHNIKNYQSKLPKTCKIMCVVKANAYGHGAVATSLALQEMGMDFFATATLNEAIEIREAGITQEILVLGYTHPTGFDKLVKYDITQTMTSVEHGRMIEEWCRDNKARIKCHIAVDSGMHRIGCMPEEVEEIREFYHSEHLDITGLYSHLCVGDSDAEDSIEFSTKQADIFDAVVHELQCADIDLGTVHLLSSYPAINYPDRNYDYARLGVLMFGTLSSDRDYLREDLDLWPVMQIKARITSVRWIEAGETVSYGRIFQATKPTKVASVAVGYADGFPRMLSGGALRAIVGGKYVHNIGRICMDQLMLDVTDIENVKTGDEIILVGSDNGLSIRIEELADQTSSISNEILSRLGARIEGRIFVK